MKLDLMKNEIPNIKFCKQEGVYIEVIDFEQLTKKLDETIGHDPFAIHKIEFYLILVVTKNNYTHFVDFKSFELTEGSTLFVTKSQVHHFNKTLTNADGFAIIFDANFLDSTIFLSGKNKINRLFNYHAKTPVIHQKEMGEDNLIEVAHNLLKEYNSVNDFAKNEMLSAQLLILFLKAERVKQIYSTNKIKTYWIEIFSAFTRLVEKDYKQTRSARDYSSNLSISYKLLNDVVKKLAGKTVKNFIDDFVIMEIKRYLASTSLSVKEISFKTGFEEPSNMAKFFKTHTDTTPLKFREQI